VTSTPGRRRAYNSASVRPYVACDCSLVSLVSADLREDLYFCRAAERALRHTCRLFRIPGHIVERSASAGHSQTDISPSPDALSCPASRTRFSLPSLPLPALFLSPSGCKSCSRFTGCGESSQSGVVRVMTTKKKLTQPAHVAKIGRGSLLADRVVRNDVRSFTICSVSRVRRGVPCVF